MTDKMRITDLHLEAAKLAVVKYSVPLPPNEAMRDMLAAAISLGVPSPPDQVEALKAKLRQIISHATMGQTDGEGMSVNDICVQITALRNDLYHAALSRNSSTEETVGDAITAKGGADGPQS
jgi:hypothetical protein